MQPGTEPLLLGVDFSCAPSPRKPITVAQGCWVGGELLVSEVERLASLSDFEALLRRPGPWLGGFDFPFGLPRPFVDALNLGSDCRSVSTELHRRCANRMSFRALVDQFGNARAAGQRLPHRRCDTAFDGTRSSSPLQTRYVPVGFMYFEGLARLLAAGLCLPGLAEGDPARRAFEAYPGALAFELIGRRSYKNSAAADRRQARRELLARLKKGQSRLAAPLRLGAALQRRLMADESGDQIDAVLALVQVAWASRVPGFGLPADIDPVEGWILTAGPSPSVWPGVVSPSGQPPAARAGTLPA
jgi:Protein of unknown function (DUF429)